jgi:hypothetical protein
MKQSHHLYRHIIVFSVAALIVALACVSFVIYIYASRFDPVFPATREHLGVLGDYLGGTLGPLLNLVTVAMLVASFLFQHQQVKDAKAAAIEAQQHAKNEFRLLHKQSFEQTFFTWLKNYHEYVSGITRLSSGDDNRELNGQRALMRIWNDYMVGNVLAATAEKAKVSDKGTVEYNLKLIRNDKDFDHDLMLEAYVAAFHAMYKAQASTVGTMLRILYRLIKWIDESDLTPEERYSYIAIVRAQLSMTELGFLMINGLTERGLKFRNYVNKYALLDNIESHVFVRALVKATTPRGYEPRAFDADLAKSLLQ